MQYVLQERMKGRKYIDVTTDAGLGVGPCVDQRYVTVTVVTID